MSRLPWDRDRPPGARREEPEPTRASQETVAGLPVHPATGLYRWWIFRQRLTEEIDRARRYDHRVSLALFEPANLLPEPPPPLVYAAAAQALRRALRGFDFAAQFDDQRFVVLLPETGRTGAKAALQRLLAALRISSDPTVEWRGVVVTCPHDATDALALVDQAEGKLYQARHGVGAEPESASAGDGGSGEAA